MWSVCVLFFCFRPAWLVKYFFLYTCLGNYFFLFTFTPAWVIIFLFFLLHCLIEYLNIGLLLGETRINHTLVEYGMGKTQFQQSGMRW